MTLQHELGLDQPFADLGHETVLSIVRTAALLSQAGSELFRGHDLTEAQFNVLLVLKYATGEVIQTELGRRLVVTRASITSVLDRLEQKGLVERRGVPGNRRVKKVLLTKTGHTLIDEMEPLYRARIHAILDEVPEMDCRQLITRLEQIRQALSQSTLGETHF
ncbi:MAG: MarR family transcriptional regulator [Candidatus Hydrogenedentes bacterium]|nr:MarR family transcriptional regulator [Candidatus Hydrogenedentota bacterium]